LKPAFLEKAAVKIGSWKTKLLC